MRNIRQNLGLAFVYNVAGIPIAAGISHGSRGCRAIDRFTVIRRGEMVGTYTRDEVDEKDIADLITGERER